jgi:vitamin B12 transport system substrate-binding protein
MLRLLAALLACLALPVAAAERVISLAPALSEIMLELGAADRLVGMLDGTERPAALASVPSVGRYGQVELETLLSLKPDLILLWPNSIPESMQAQIRQFGIPTYVAEPHRLAELAKQFSEVGERVGHAEQGHALEQRFTEGMAALRQRYRREQPLRVFYQVWDAPLYTVGGQQIISDALRVCGARNVFDELSSPAPQVSIEAVLQRDPQVIFGPNQAQLNGWRAWPELTAVRQRHLWPVPDNGVERPSFQMLAATQKLCEQLAAAGAP